MRGRCCCSLSFSLMKTDGQMDGQNFYIVTGEILHSVGFDYINIPLLSVGNRPIGQEEEGERKKEEEGGGVEERKKKEGEDGRTDGRTMFLYESRKKTFLQSVLITLELH